MDKQNVNLITFKLSTIFYDFFMVQFGNEMNIIIFS